MGFKLNRTYRLVFEGGMEGAEVVFKTTPVSVVMEVQAGLRAGLKADAVADKFVAYVAEWNLETADGEPLPITTEAIMEHMEESVMARILHEWIQAARGITAPLDGPSTSGGQSPEESIPMETL